MTKEDMQQHCLDLSNAAIALFDIIDKEGINAPIEDSYNILKLKAIVDSSDKIIGYYQNRNVQRMLALGISPEALIRMSQQ